MPKITNFLWFDHQAEQAARFYTGVFPNSRIVGTTHHGSAGPGSDRSVMTVEFELDGTPFVALNGGPQKFRFDESISFQVDCRDQDEVDAYWSALTDGGEEGPCGWLKDKYGVSWQVTPTRLTELTGSPDPETAQRAMNAMFEMTKIDIAALERAVATGS
ncbi:MAG: VOC family protein [Nocardioidaceae bacterium]